MAFRCLSCESPDPKWENVDRFRNKAEGMHICMNCGFITYPLKYQKNDEIQYHYKHHYRNSPNASNFFTGQRKLHYHNAFLSDLLLKLKERAEVNALEIGGAIGLFLNWVKRVIPHANIHGTEWDEKMARVAFIEYGVDLKNDYDESIKYDLIASYKVGEHQLDFDKEILKYRECLKDDGYFYISVPTWFHALKNFGIGGFDIEYYFSPNHINVWSRACFERILKRCGFKIIKEDHLFYEDTYLCQKGEFIASQEYDGYDKVIKYLEKIKKASDLLSAGKAKEAIEAWPVTPVAFAVYYEQNRAPSHALGFDYIENEFIKTAMKHCDSDFDALIFAGDLYRRYNKFELAIRSFEKAFSVRPGSPVALIKLCETFMMAAHEKDVDALARDKYLYQTVKIAKQIPALSLQHVPDAFNWLFAAESELSKEGYLRCKEEDNGQRAGSEKETK